MAKAYFFFLFLEASIGGREASYCKAKNGVNSAYDIQHCDNIDSKHLYTFQNWEKLPHTRCCFLPVSALVSLFSRHVFALV